MRREYDFSKADKGRFYRAGAKVNLPVYLDKKNAAFVRTIAEKTHSDFSKIVNDLIEADRRIAHVAR